jgi:hypothetical protein
MPFYSLPDDVLREICWCLPDYRALYPFMLTGRRTHYAVHHCGRRFATTHIYPHFFTTMLAGATAKENQLMVDAMSNRLRHSKWVKRSKSRTVEADIPVRRIAIYTQIPCPQYLDEGRIAGTAPGTGAKPLWLRVLESAGKVEQLSIMCPHDPRESYPWLPVRRALDLSIMPQDQGLTGLAISGFLIQLPSQGVVFDTLTKLRLEAWSDMYGPIDVQRIVDAMPNLESLHVSMCPWDTLGTIPLCAPLTNLRHLTLRATQTEIRLYGGVNLTIGDVTQVSPCHVLSAGPLKTS